MRVTKTFNREIRYRLFKHGISQRKLSRELGYSERSVTDAINKRELSAKTKQKYLNAIKRIVEKEAKERDIKINRNEE